MTRWLISLLLQGIVLPLALIFATIARQNGESGLYLIFLFINPLVPVPTPKSMHGPTGVYQKVVILVSVVNSFASLAFQIVLTSFPPYGSFVSPPCSTFEREMRYAGLVRLNQLTSLEVFWLVCPEFVVALTGILVHTCCLKLNPRPGSSSVQDNLLPIVEPPPAPTSAESAKNQRKLNLLVSLGKYICLMSMFFAGTITPSGLNSVYFLLFLGCMTWWSCNKPLGRPFAWLLRLLMFFIAAHITFIYLYQMQWSQELLGDGGPIPRYLGLRALFLTNCSDPRVPSDTDKWHWDSFVNPLALVLLYYVCALEASLIINVPVVELKEGELSRQLSTRLSQKGKLLRNQTSRWRSATRKVRDPAPVSTEDSTPMTESTPLIRGKESLYRKNAPRRGVVQDARGSVTVTEVTDDKENSSQGEDSGGNLVEVIINVGIAIAVFLQQTSYIATNIIMMTWSITYHSWITFVLLLWASLMWLVPNQRKAMLRSSPFLVFYALFLLIGQYLYGMDLTEDELPDNIQGVNLKQIGFSKDLNFPVKPLLFKTLFTIMFWITLRQYVQEKWEERNQTAMERIAAPLQIGVGTAAGISGESSAKTNNLIRKIGTLTRSLLTKFWIWVVACILFTIGIVGERMTIFRIIYMGMALLFILTFQLSWTLWRKIMYGFWLVVIIFSMFILICTYTYQFDNFDRYWAEYLHIPLQLQQDIGLERYETTELFVKLLTPTFFVIITVIQLYYFHNDFLAISDIKSRGTSVIGQSDRTGPTAGSSKGDSTTSVEDYSNVFWTICDKIWLFLELHLMKGIILSLMLLAINEVCAAHYSFVVLSVVANVLNSRFQVMVAHLCSCLISILIITKMIYQINYIDHGSWNVTCLDTNVTANDAEWFGFQKVGSHETLSGLLKGYIGMEHWYVGPVYITYVSGVLLIITFHAVVVRRQKFQRHERGRPLTRPHVMYPRVTYLDKDKDTRYFLKYMLNFGFFRLGVEVTLISIVALIGFRMDFFATLYAFWLVILVSPNRKKLSRIWTILKSFIVFTILFQYAMAVGIVPELCIDYPWDASSTLMGLRDWMFLPDNKHPPPVRKLIWDFIVLMLVCRQGLVFREEKRNRNNEFKGGSNEPITDVFDTVGLVNPVPDFISTTRSVLDVIKRIVLSALFWVTLAVFFLAGTNRVNIFSMGYLIGAFVFLWHGNDFYLRPISTILKWWNCLIMYNVSVILSKTLLQIFGCIFMSQLKENACWMIQLFGIACVRQFVASGPVIPDVNECKIPLGEAGLAWDFCCFALLIIQRRLISSYYFLRIINEAKAMAILASRGAELIEELSQRRVQAQMESENKLLEKIKNKMDRIKASQKRIQGPNYKDPEDHATEGEKREGAPLAHDSTPSISSPTVSSPHQGFHTPVDDGADDELEDRDGFALDEGLSRGGSFLHPPTPTSAILSRSLDGYLDPHRISFGSPPPPSDLQRVPSFDDSFPVFSPPPYGSLIHSQSRHRRTSSFFSASAQTSAATSAPHGWPPSFATPRESIISSASLKSHHTSIRSGDYYMFEDFEEDLDLISEKSESLKSEISDDQVDMRRTSFPQLISTAMKSDMRQATAEAKDAYEESKAIAREQRERAATPGKEHPSDTSDGSDTGDRHSRKSKLKARSKSLQEDDRIALVEDAPEPPPSIKEKIIIFLKFIIEFVNSAMVSITRTLNKTSRDYRYVMKTLTLEKKQLLAMPNFGQGHRPPPSRIWRPPHTAVARISAESDSIPEAVAESSPSEDISPEPVDVEKGQSPAVSIGQFEEGELRASDQPPIVRMVIALWFAVLSHSDLVCYFVIFLHQICSPTILSLPLPLMVFFWGTLTVPRPSRRFWITIIGYTEVVVVIKCMFQFEMLPWNRKSIPENAPFALPRILGIERQPGTYAYFDLLILLVVFFHRAMLKSLGLWKTSFVSREQLSTRQTPTPTSSDKKSGSNVNVATGQEVVPHGYFSDHKTLSKYKCFHPFQKFFQKLLRSKGRVTTDVYAYMFFCDFFNFIVVIFGFAAFGSNQGDGGVSEYFEENKVPVAFLVMLILQFALIIVDRTLYLRKYILGKLVFQYILVFGIHIWMFFILPAVTQKRFNAATPPQLWYMVKCFYLLLSAYQIRCGYPSRIYGNFLCKGYNYINYFLFKMFMMVPFVFELRALMDWIWTDTSMTLSDWLKMEDIFAHVYQLKCQRRAEREYPQPRGVKKSSASKYIVGGGCLVLIIAAIWFPLVLFALGNTVGRPNPPTDVTVSVRIGAYAPIYQYTAQNDSIYTISSQDWDFISSRYWKSRTAQTFLSNYLFDDVAIVALSPHSTAVWTISPPDNLTLIGDLQGDKPIPIRLDWTIVRQTTSSEHPGTVSSSQEGLISPNDPNRKILINYLQDAYKDDPYRPKVGLNPLFPKFVKVTNRGTAFPVPQLMVFNDESTVVHSPYRGLLGELRRSTNAMWWEMNENCSESDPITKELELFPYLANCSRLVMYTFNDKAFPATLSAISGKGIIGLYTTFVIVIHSFIRGFFTGISFKIMFDDMPNVDRLLQLCLDIYLVRESRELDLEEDLFAKLVFLYRSPETLIKWTRPPEEIGEDEVDEQPDLD